MKSLKLILALAALTILQGCGATGPKFREVVYPIENESVVYFYRPSEYVAGGLSPTVFDNGEPVSKLSNGGYFVHRVESGRHEFVTDSAMNIDKPLSFEINPREIHFIRLDYKSGVFTGTWMLNKIFEHQALEEIKECNAQGK